MVQIAEDKELDGSDQFQLGDPGEATSRYLTGGSSMRFIPEYLTINQA
jgi:hypothetical protein